MTRYLRPLSLIAKFVLIFSFFILILNARSLIDANNNLLPVSNLKTDEITPAPLTLSNKDKQELEKGLKTGAEEKNEDNTRLFSILAENITTIGDVLIGKNRAVLLNKQIYAMADNIYYNIKTKQVRLVDNVRIYKGDNLYLQTRQANLYLNSDYTIVQPFYVQDSKTGIWMNAISAASRDNIFTFKSATVSGCSIDNPAWRIDSSNGDYDKNKSIVTLWNARIYLGDVPIFYSPYLRFSTENKRTSGFLYPVLGSALIDGVVYIQPYYFAPYNMWDMTFSPQVRSNKGIGMNYEFRIVDSSDDMYILHAKFFNQYNSYVKQLNLLDKYIYGFDFKGSKRNFLKKFFNIDTDYDNGIYIDFLYMNNLDYLRLDSLTYYVTAPYYTSRINFYAQTQNNYFGMNFKYFINYTSGSNLSTFQNLPNLQYHKYLDSLFFKELLYSIDYQFKHVYRQDGYTYLSNEIYVPFGAQFPVFEDFVSLGVWANFRAGNINMFNIDNTYVFRNENFAQKLQENTGSYIATNYKVSINTDLGRDYQYFFHSFQGSLAIISPFARGVFTNGILSNDILQTYGLLNTNSLSKVQNGGNIFDPSVFSSVFLSKNVVNINMANYFYTPKGKDLFSWRLSQVLDLENITKAPQVPMENKLSTSIARINLSASVFYSWLYSAFTEVGLSSSYSNKYFTIAASYYLKRDDTKFSFDSDTLTYKIVDSSNYLNLGLSGDVGYFNFSAGVGFDFRTNTVLNYNIGIYKNIRCFGIGFKLGSDRTPILTQSSSMDGQVSVIQNDYIKFELKFSPLTSIGYTYRLKPTISQE